MHDSRSFLQLFSRNLEEKWSEQTFQSDERYLADALESVPLIKGDNVMVPYFGGRLTFQVIGVTPAADAVLVTQKTTFQWCGFSL